MIDIKVPEIGESIQEATITEWLKKDGEYVERDQVIAELESEKASFELPAEQAGILKIVVEEGEDVEIGQVIAKIDETAKKPEGTSSSKEEVSSDSSDEEKEGKETKDTIEEAPSEKREPVGKGIIEIKIPQIGESITEVTLIEWTKEEGDFVERDEIIAELESEKASFEVNAEEAGILHHQAQVDDDLEIGQVVATIDTDAPVPAQKSSPQKEVSAKAAALSKETKIAVEKPQKETPVEAETSKSPAENKSHATPVASAMMADKNLKAIDVKGSGPRGKIFKHDVMAALENPGTNIDLPLFGREERREKMSRLRRTISRRLVEAKNGSAMLTTFNEADMGPIKEIRKKYKQVFKEKHGVGLGFMSFFTKACAFALQEYPAVNAYLDEDELIYHDYCDVSIAVSTPKGLVVPVIRNAESLSMAGIEQAVVDIATKARNNKLTMDEMTGGTFTITNGGVFGSLMSTPIINPPQSAILGMHKIEDRPIAVNGQVVIKPMMYLALSYDHRVIDGKESVSFLVKVKEYLEHPERLLFGKDPITTLLEL